MTINNERKSWFYPGSIWAKRITRLLVISGIGLNLFINNLQKELIITASEMLVLAESLESPANSLKELTEDNIIPFLEYVENSPASSLVSGFPTSEDLTLISENYTVYQKTLKDTGKLLNYLAIFLRIANILFWIPISISVIWLLYDLQYGQVKLFILISLGLIGWFNYISYKWLFENIAI